MQICYGERSYIDRNYRCVSLTRKKIQCLNSQCWRSRKISPEKPIEIKRSRRSNALRHCLESYWTCCMDQHRCRKPNPKSETILPWLGLNYIPHLNNHAAGHRGVVKSCALELCWKYFQPQIHGMTWLAGAGSYKMIGSLMACAPHVIIRREITPWGS